MPLLFAYGTLLSRDVIERVTGSSHEAIPAVLTGYRRLCVQGAAYPGLVPGGDGKVEGLLYQHLDPSALDRLDRFEGAIYERRLVEVTVGDGRTLEAFAYVVREDQRHRLTDEEWDHRQFLEQGKALNPNGYQECQASELPNG
jgi:gamma-glutamylcyclotransferase (GGCT)/AIG2-like uncharacterized protein YtfP